MESQRRSLGYRDALAAREECSTLTLMTVCVIPVLGSVAITVYGEVLTLILSSLRNPVKFNQSILLLGHHFIGS